jgi:proline iminopeptidase
MILDVEQAQETWLDIQDEDSGHKYQIWFRTWGRMDGTGIPIVFIHGGPGNAIADYFGNSNKRFFADDAHSFYVVEIDQRGTGNSRPSVRDDWHNMEYYQDISIDKMCADFEAVRTYLGIDQWLVWGGSFGSTLAINYGERYPESCLALIIRGIYLDTADEVQFIYSRNTYIHNPKRLREFDILYQYAADYVEKKHSNNHDDNSGGSDVSDSSDPFLDPNDAERILRVYAEMITSGDKYAIWHWFVFENNLMELDPANLYDPDQIDNKVFRESQSVAFFETRLWLHGSFEYPTSDLMDDTKIRQLSMPLWICQGQHDEVCPPQYARGFVDAIVEAGESPWVVSRFLNGTHEDTDPAIAMCLQQSLREFVEYSSNT